MDHYTKFVQHYSYYSVYQWFILFSFPQFFELKNTKLVSVQLYVQNRSIRHRLFYMTECAQHSTTVRYRMMVSLFTILKYTYCKRKIVTDERLNSESMFWAFHTHSTLYLIQAPSRRPYVTAVLGYNHQMTASVTEHCTN